ncbi:MAG: TlpA disulfide reductase family protein [Phycisphaerales bacterium]
MNRSCFALSLVAAVGLAAVVTPATFARGDEFVQYGGAKNDPRDKSTERTPAKKGDDKKGDDKKGDAGAAPSVDQSWLDRLSREDRAAIEPLMGLAPPPFTKDIEWLGMPAATWKDLRGKVVVVQTWTSRSSGGRMLLSRMKDELKEFKPEDLIVIGLHTPEGADKAEEFLKKSPVDVGVAVDPSGDFCDALGAFKRPVNVVVDRNGTVRYVGLNPVGLPKAVAELVKEAADPSAKPKDEPTKETSVAESKWPTFDNPLSRARDLRGKSGPAFAVADWVTDQASPQGRLLLVDFFATWCGPCMAAVPHMNELAAKFGRDVCIIGLSDESKGQVQQGLLKRNMKANNFRYSLAVDPNARMKNAFGITAIPHCVIMSPDGIVRWQGHPTELTESVMQSLVAANKANGGATKGGEVPHARWAAEKKRG